MASTIWAQAGPTGVTGYAYTGESNGTYGLYFTVAAAGTLQAVWFYSPPPAAGNALPSNVGLFDYATQALLTSSATPSWSGAAGSGWVRATVPGYALAAAHGYMAYYYIPVTTGNNQGYIYTGASPAAWFPSSSADGNITAPQATPASNNAPYNSGGNAFPATYNGNNLNWLLDVEVSFAAAPPAPPLPAPVPPGLFSPMSLAVLPPPPPAPPPPPGAHPAAATLTGTGVLAAGRLVTFAPAAALTGTGTLSAAAAGAYRLFGSASGPSTATSHTGNFISGTTFAVSGGGCWLAGYWWWVCASGQSTSPVKCALWSATSGGGSVVTGSVVTSGTLTAGQWNYVPLSAPVQLAPSLDPASPADGSAYVAAVGVNGSFPDTASYWGTGQAAPSGITSGPLTAYSGPGAALPAPYSLPQGCFTTGGSDPAVTMPQSSSGTDNFWVDVQVTTAPPPGYTGSYRLWPGKADSNAATVFDSSVAYNVATEVGLSAPCRLNAVHYFVPDSASGAAGLATRADVWDITSHAAVATIASPSWTTESGGTVTIGAAGQWVKAAFPAGTVLPAGKYRVSVYNANGGLGGWNAKDAGTGYFSTGVAAAGITWGPLSAPNQASAQPATYYPGTGTGSTGGQPVFAWTGSDDFPSVTTGLNPAQVYWVDLEVTPSVGYSPAAALTGLGALTAGAVVSVPAAAALSGTGVLTAAGTVTQPAAAALSGTGSLTAARLVTQPAAAALSGTGLLAAGALVTRPASAALSGAGALTAAALVTQPASAALTGTGTLSAAGPVQFTSAASLAGTGTLTAAALVTVPAAAALTGTGLVTVTPSVQFTAAAVLAGTGSLTAGAVVTQPAAAALSGTGLAVISASVRFASAAALSGTGSLGAAGAVSGLAQASAALAGTGALTAGVTLAIAGGAALSGTGTLTAAALVTVPAAAGLTGTGLLTVTATVTLPASAALTGTGTMTAAVTLAPPASAALTGTGTLTAGASLTVTAAAALSGLGVITVTARVTSPVTEPAVAWQAAPAAPRWKCGPSAPRWRIAMTLFSPIAAVSLECVNVLWLSGLAGTVVDPTGATAGEPELPVQMAFPVSSGDPARPAEPVTWLTASWLLGGTSIGYIAQALVGPGSGVVTLTAGLPVDVWCAILGTPESPRKFAGTLPVY